MKLRNLFITLGLSLTVGVGVLVGTLNGSNQSFEEADATIWRQNPTLYFVPSNNWAKDSASFKAEYYDNATKKGTATAVDTGYEFDGRKVYSLTISDGSWVSAVKMLRMSSNGSTQWNASAKFDISDSYDSNVNSLFMKADYSSYDNWSTGADVYWQKYMVDTFSLIGSFGGHSWDYDVDFTVNTASHTATLTDYSLSKGDALKIRNNHAWVADYGWSNVSSQNITDPNDRGENCFGNADGNIAVLHDGTYTFTLNYLTGAISITGTRAINDSDVNFEMYISSGGESYAPVTMELKTGSTTEFMITRDFATGEKFYFKYGSYYYHYSDVKSSCTLLGTQFIQEGNDVKALYHANYTIYFETASGDNFGAWLQYNSVSSAQVRSNVISFAQYFNEQVGGACDDQGETEISDLQTAWQNTQTRYANEPDNAIKTAIAGVTTSDLNDDVAEFAGKYDKVYYLRGNSLGQSGGEYLARGITPRQAMRTNVVGNDSNVFATVFVIIISMSVLTIAAYYFFKRSKKA